MIKGRKLVWLISLVVAVSLLSQPVSAGVDDFHFDKMEVDYYLNKDAEGRAQLKVKETLVAVFPEHNQNRGIVRSIPLNYQEHPLSFQLGKLRRNGQKANLYKDQTEKGFRTLMIRDQHDQSFLHGANTYEINYTMRDVIHQPKNAKIDEFYWDTNGTGWRQRFNQVIARVHLDQSIKDQLLAEKMACYTGRQGESNRDCQIETNQQRDVITVKTTKSLPAKHNLTLAIGFQAKTFTNYLVPTWKLVAAWGLVVASLAGLVLAILTRRNHKHAVRRQISSIYPAEYLPPKLGIFANYHLYHDLKIMPSKMLTIGLLDLAVRHKLKIVKLNGSSKTQPEFGVEIIDNQLTDDETKFLNVVFQKPLEIGKTYKIRTKDYKLPERLRSFLRRIVKEMKQSELVDQAASKRLSKQLTQKAIIAGVLALFGHILLYTLGDHKYGLPWLVTDDGVLSLLVIGQIVSGVLVTIILAKLGDCIVLTKDGVGLKTQLLGLKKYISMAETDRLAFNQSVQTAEMDAKHRVGLYERLLPYAVMFSLEKSWASVLKTVYEETNQSPTWSDGEAFAAERMADSLQRFSKTATVAAMAVDPSSSSYSSDSGSSGGGSSGGGGGGGGGGGC